MRGHPHELLSAYLDDALSPTDAAMVAAHLAECPTCREMVADLHALRGLLGRLPAPAPHPALLPRTLARLSGRAFHRRPPLRRLAAAGVLVAGLLLALQARPLPRPSTAEARDWYFQSHARLSALHPMADVSLASYLGTPLPYQSSGP